MNESKTIQKQSQIDEQGEFLQKSIDQLMQSVEYLEARLERVCRGIEPKEEKEGAEANLVPFANFIRQRTWAIQGIRSRVDSILERLEL